MKKMKKQILLAAIAIAAIVLLALYYNGFVLFALVLFIPLFLWRKSANKDDESEPHVNKLTLDEAVNQYGEPDEHIVVDATLANESAGCILVYKDKRLLVVAGEPVGMGSVTDVSTVNTATPYTIGQYQLVLTTNIAGRQYIRVNVGMDAEWARNVAMQVIDAMRKS